MAQTYEGDSSQYGRVDVVINPRKHGTSFIVRAGRKAIDFFFSREKGHTAREDFRKHARTQFNWLRTRSNASYRRTHNS